MGGYTVDCGMCFHPVAMPVAECLWLASRCPWGGCRLRMPLLSTLLPQLSGGLKPCAWQHNGSVQAASSYTQILAFSAWFSPTTYSGGAR